MSVLRWVSLFVLVVLLSCRPKGAGSECDSKTSCDFGEVCNNGYCEGASCNTSAECPMEQYCNDKRQCQKGCKGDSDCYPGRSCDDDIGVCKATKCTDAHLDCGFNEYCNVATGECYDAGERFCRPCREDGDCGGGYCFLGACTVDCSEGQACPSGFECWPFGDGNGNITSYECVAYCGLYDDYQPGSF